MSSAMYEHMRSNPKFQSLVRTRGRFAGILSAIVLAGFYGFVMLVAFKPALLGTPVREGAALTIGVAMGLTIFVSFWLLTALYVRRANTEFDALTEEIVKEARHAEHAAVGLCLDGGLQVAEIEVLPDVVEEEVDGGQRHAGRREIRVRRDEADAELAHQRGGELLLEQARKGAVQVLKHASPRVLVEPRRRAEQVSRPRPSSS